MILRKEKNAKVEHLKHLPFFYAAFFKKAEQTKLNNIQPRDKDIRDLLEI